MPAEYGRDLLCGDHKTMLMSLGCIISPPGGLSDKNLSSKRSKLYFTALYGFIFIFRGEMANAAADAMGRR